MAEVAKLEKVLGVRLQSENVEFIQQNYDAFYKDPLSFIGDKLVDMILEDLDLKVPTGLEDIISMVPGMDVKHTDTYGTLAWGNYKGSPMYALLITGSAVRTLKETLRTDMFMRDLPGSTLVATIAASHDEERAVVFVQERGDLAAIGDLPFTICDIPGFEKVAMLPVFSPEAGVTVAQFYVPFVQAGKGRNPVMWTNLADPIQGSDKSLFEHLNNGLDFESGIDSEAFKAVKLNIGNYYPSVDLDKDSDERYQVLDCWGSQLIYNRNALAYSGNIHTQNALLPWAIACMVSYGSDGVHTNMYDVVSGTYEWEDLFFRFDDGKTDPAETGHPNMEDVYETRVIGGIRTMGTKEKLDAREAAVNSPNYGQPIPDPEKEKLAGDPTVNMTPFDILGQAMANNQVKQLGKSGATTRLGKALANATGSYEQEDLGPSTGTVK